MNFYEPIKYLLIFILSCMGGYMLVRLFSSAIFRSYFESRTKYEMFKKLITKEGRTKHDRKTTTNTKN